MIAVDTNILVYAHREDSEFYPEALKTILGLAEGNRLWGIPWPCVHEFISVVTHPSIYNPPTDIKTALDAIEVWLESSFCQMIGEGKGYFQRLREFAQAGKVRGPMIHDARIAAVCLYNGVTELWTADRDFSRFRQLKISNPLTRSQ
jgi:hypothetical protein